MTNQHSKGTTMHTPDHPADHMDDAELRRALSSHDQRLADEMPDYQSVFSLMAGSLRGGFRPYFLLGILMTTAVTVFCVVAIVQVFKAESTKHMLLWSLAAGGAFVWVGLAKVWMWMQFERRALLIELKRAELRVLAALDRGHGDG